MGKINLKEGIKILIFFTVFFFCGFISPVCGDTNIIVNGQNIKFSIVRFYSNGNVKKGILSENVKLKIKDDIIEFKSMFNEAVDMSSFDEKIIPIAEESAEQGAFCIYFYKNGSVEYGIPEKDVTIKIGQDKVTFFGGLPISFYPNGNIKSGYLKRGPIVNLENCSYFIKGIRFAADNMGPIFFYKSGKVKSDVLAEDTVIKGTKCKKDERVSLDKKGNIIKHKIYKSLKYDKDGNILE